jgi:UPF0716 family protein affecting phage T7 exclusion
MITPGFITDCLALLLLFPPTRALVRRTLLTSAVRRGRVTVVSGGRVRRTGNGNGSGRDVWDVESWEVPPRGRDELGDPS